MNSDEGRTELLRTIPGMDRDSLINKICKNLKDDITAGEIDCLIMKGRKLKYSIKIEIDDSNIERLKEGGDLSDDKEKKDGRSFMG